MSVFCQEDGRRSCDISVGWMMHSEAAALCACHHKPQQLPYPYRLGPTSAGLVREMCAVIGLPGFYLRALTVLLGGAWYVLGSGFLNKFRRESCHTTKRELCSWVGGMNQTSICVLRA